MTGYARPEHLFLAFVFAVVILFQSLVIASPGPAVPPATAPAAVPAPAAQPDYPYPRIGNLFEADVRPTYAPMLSKWQLVGLTASIQDASPALLTTVRSLNPHTKLLAYFPAGMIWADYASYGPLAAAYGAKLEAEDWWLYDNLGNRVGQRGTLWYVNLSSKCAPDGSHEILAEWLAHYIAGEVTATGYWDGLILDGTDEDIQWINDFPGLFHQFPAGVDCDRDGVADNPDSLYAWWKRGVEIFLSTLRHDAGPSCILIPNGINYMYQYANGGIREDFPHMHGGWQENMFAPYGYMNDCDNFLHDPLNASMLLCYWRQGPLSVLAPPKTSQFLQFARFTLASALLGDGFYFLDAGTGGSLWWLDYYDLDLGTPTGAAYMDASTVWRREFTNASIYCNPSLVPVTLDDGTVLSPEDGAIKVHTLPGPLSCSFLRATLERKIVQRQKAIDADVIVDNRFAKAAQGYVRLDLLKQDRVVASGPPVECIVGARSADTLSVRLPLNSTQGLATYCLRVSVSGPDLVPTGQDTVWLAKPNDHGKKSDGGKSTGGDTSGDTLAVFPQPIVVSSGVPLTIMTSDAAGTRCTVEFYDAAGRLVATAFDGRFEDGQVVIVADPASGNAPRAPGVYFLRVETGNRITTKRIVVLK